jgi:hypothetical protein
MRFVVIALMAALVGAPGLLHAQGEGVGPIRNHNLPRPPYVSREDSANLLPPRSARGEHKTSRTPNVWYGLVALSVLAGTIWLASLPGGGSGPGPSDRAESAESPGASGSQVAGPGAGPPVPEVSTGSDVLEEQRSTVITVGLLLLLAMAAALLKDVSRTRPAPPPPGPESDCVTQCLPYLGPGRTYRGRSGHKYTNDLGGQWAYWRCLAECEGRAP